MASPGPDQSSLELAALGALRQVVDPELGDDIVELGMVRSLRCTDGVVHVEVALTTAGCPLRRELQEGVEQALAALPGVRGVVVTTGLMDGAERAALMSRARRAAQRPVPTEVPDSARIFAVGSGKGGVGKSSIAVNLAAALAAEGRVVGLLDADIWGFSVPRMLGIEERLEARGGRIVPVQRPAGAGTLRAISMGFLSGEGEAIMWRGLMLNRAVQHFLEDVAWGALDVLVIDLPPGTGDVSMGLARMLPRAELLVVTTPALAAQMVAGRAADMARRGHLHVAGVIESMSGFVCEHGTRHALFGEGGGERLAAELGVPLVGSVPLHHSVAAGGDAGSPVALDASSPLAPVFAGLATRVLALPQAPAPPLPVHGCGARLLEQVEAALAARDGDARELAAG
ncbi:MAG TPA: P-loop NTPase [Acidimicrobiales bacterium]|nr:P-loop NTPase [Acidimicrobiales bacterium]